MKVNLAQSVALNRKGEIFRISEVNRLVKTRVLTPAESEIAALTKIEYFHRPFQAIVATDGKGEIKSQWKIHPNTFYPLSPLDYAEAVEEFSQGEKPLPRQIFVNLSDRCNFGCRVCFTAEERGPADLSAEAYLETLKYLRSFERPLNQTISGGGEPTLHPDFVSILNFAGEHGINTFLTTNGSRKDRPFMESVAHHASIATFSIQGISAEAYQRVMRPPRGITLERIFQNIETLSGLREKYRRKREMLIGVTSLVHPANTGHYTDFVRRLVELGVVYIHFNPILPNLKAYGVKFAPEEAQKTEEELASLPQEFTGQRIFIRTPEKIFLEEDSFFFNPSVRKNPDVCLVSLLQPSILPVVNHPNRAKVVTCRFHPITTTNPNYWYTSDLGPKTFESIWTDENIRRVQEQTRKCTQCSLERQLMALDWMLYIKKTLPEAEFYLLFPLHLEQKGVAAYAETIEKSYHQ